MIQVTSHMRLFAAIEPLNFQKRLDGTIGVCRTKFEVDPYDGAVYLFRNRRKC
jgi:transposase